MAVCCVGDILREAGVIWGARLADNAGTARRRERRAAIATANCNRTSGVERLVNRYRLEAKSSLMLFLQEELQVYRRSTSTTFVQED